MIKAIIFDCFGVLTTEGYGPFRDKYISNPADRALANQTMDDLCEGKVTYPEFLKSLASLGGVSEAETQSYLTRNLPNDTLFDYIRRIKPKYKIGMLSNAGEDWTKEMFTTDDLKLFDDIVLSFHIGTIKPNPIMYNTAAERLGVANQEAVFIDDILAYCQGAEKTGMKAVFYKDFGQMKTELEEILAAASNN